MRKTISNRDAQLLAKLGGSVSHYDHADEQVAVAMPSDKLKIGKLPGNPSFKANTDIVMRVYYFEVAAGVYTELTAAQLLAQHVALATQLSAFVFGHSDFASGFKKAKGQFALSGGWNYGVPFIYGTETNPSSQFAAFDNTVKAKLQLGDMVQQFYATDSGDSVVALVVIRSSSVGYGTLLNALSSDRFWINQIRYILTDTSATGLEQYNNDIELQKQSLFGKFNSDTANPDAFKVPEQFQQGIVDIPIKDGVDKSVLWGLYINYNSVYQKWSTFIANADKVQA